MSTLTNLIKQANSYRVAHSRWVAAGKPLRPHDKIESLFEICESCPRFMRVGADIGKCKSCGCWLKRKGEKFNKLAWPTETCPEGKWHSEVESE